MNDVFLLRGLSMALAIVWLSSCGGKNYNSNSTTNQPVTTAFIRIVNTIPDSPTLGVGADGLTLTRVSFGQSTGLQQVPSGKYSLNVQYLDTSNTAVALINKQQLNLTVDDQTTVFIAGTLDAVHTKIVEEVAPTIAAGSAQVQVMQAAASAGTVDVYLTDAAADLATSTKLANVAFDQVSDLSTIASGTNYRLRVTAPGSTTVLYDSGVFAIEDMTRLMFVVVGYFGPGGAGFRVITLDNQNALPFPNEALPGALRVANMIADVPSVDLYVGAVTGAPAIAGVGFGSVAALRQFVPGTLQCTLTVAGSTTVLFSGPLVLSPGDTRTLVAVRSGATVAARATVDATRPIKGQGQVQIVNSAPTAGSIDSYFIRSPVTITDTTPSVVNQPLLAFASIVTAPGGDDVAFTAPESKTPIAGPTSQVIADGGSYTIYAVDSAGGGAPIQIVSNNN